MDALRQALKSLIWEQLYKFGVRFNFVAFSSAVSAWRPALVDAEEEACHDAVRWVDALTAHGNTATLEALEEAFQVS
jgi:hypothetical protein